MQNFLALGALPPDPRASGGWGFCPQTPKTAPHCEFLATRPATPTFKLIKMILKCKMPGSVGLFHIHALLESHYAILTYILHSFALCRGPRGGGGMEQCACLNGYSILVTA